MLTRYKADIADKLIFDADKHTYRVNDNNLISVTSLLKSIGYASDYAGVPKDKLRIASDKGTLIHSYLQQIFEGADVVADVNIQPYLTALKSSFWDKYYRDKNYSFELQLYSQNCEIAGTADAIIMPIFGADFELWDLKTGNYNYLDFWTCAWQVGIYKQLYNTTVAPYYNLPKINKTGVIYFAPDKNGELEMRTKYLHEMVTPKQVDKVLYDYHNTGTTTVPKIVLKSQDDVSALVDYELAQMELKTAETAYKKAKEKTEEKKKNIVDIFEKNYLREYECGLYTLKYKGGYASKRLDAVRLKAESPKIYENYIKTSWIPPSITVKNEEE